MINKNGIASVCIVLVMSLVFFQGCVAKSISPFSGKEVTSEQLAAEAKVEEVKIAREAVSIKTTSERELSDIYAAQKKAKAAFDRAVSRIQADAKLQVDNLASELEQNQLEVEATTARIIASTSAKIAELDARREANIEAAKATLADIEAKAAKYETVLSVGQTLAAGLGPYGGIAAGAIGLAGVLFGVSKRKDAQAAHENAGRIIDAIDLLKDRKPEVAQAFKSESEFLKSWMGEKAVQYVEKVQQS